MNLVCCFFYSMSGLWLCKFVGLLKFCTKIDCVIDGKTCRNLAQVFKTGKISKNLKSKKGRGIKMSGVREGKLYRPGNYKIIMETRSEKPVHQAFVLMALHLKRKHLGSPVRSNRHDGFTASVD